MKKNKWLWYFVYVLVLLCYITFSYEIVVLLKRHAETTFDTLPYFVLSMIIGIVLGILLGLERFVLERKKEGNWKINLPKLILLGVPFLYLSFGAFLYFFCPMINYPIRFFMVEINYLPVFQMILGYTICTSFIKVKPNYPKGDMQAVRGKVVETLEKP